ncbi:MAG TPA: SAM-dependent methyltransferase [Hyphomicrobiaceae bacterium]|nr:SAM-dependent methyltransferase [Hyphomicrobiaceae bacterium]
MSRCLRDPDHGYYRTRDAIGRGGDFITAPEISQVFGELIGLWAAAIWLEWGSPSRIAFVEIGPGRGAMMRDMLRAQRVVPGFLAAADIHLVEPSPHLRSVQQAAFAGLAAAPSWHADLAALDTATAAQAPERTPMLVVANEVLDTMCPEQFVRTTDGWAGRGVGLDETGRLAFVTLPSRPGDGSPSSSVGAELDRIYANAVPGDIVEWADYDIAPLLARAGTTQLYIDYGRTAPRIGDTLQAVRNHRFEHPLTSPGEADLTTEVDFPALARRIAREPHLKLHGPITQAEFLGRLGIIERASRLMAANPTDAPSIEAGVARLMAPLGMGGRFKAVAIAPRDAPTPPGFAGQG